MECISGVVVKNLCTNIEVYQVLQQIQSHSKEKTGLNFDGDLNIVIDGTPKS